MSTTLLQAGSASADRFRERYGPWALVTGASDGIGRSTAERLAAMGIDLVLVARDAGRLAAFADALRAAHDINVRVQAADLSQRAGSAAVIESVQRLDIGLIVAAAGFGTSGPFLAGDLATEQNMLDVNCGAVLALVHGFAPLLARRGRGGIVLFGSLVAWQGVPNASHYAATKAWVQTLGEGLAVELAPAGIDVLTMAPGPVGSGFAARANLQMGAADTPAMVADAMVASLGRRRAVVPGRLGKLLTYSLAPLPRFMRTFIMGKVMGGMTVHREGATAHN
ncbi:SDR family NAD(P)-dependent oxidoreductase [Sandarakinorhabdus sp.]|uniref:SDR family NAD(P)-dependent oxidoreductase n=1 Tax=Sandarakinorhabdus sp. TaxID=1916663 RepID=UPI003F7220D4